MDWPDDDFEDTLARVNDFYDQMFELAMKGCERHSGTVVASTMMGIAMRVYRTTLNDRDYYRVMEYLMNSVDAVEPYTDDELGNPTIH